MVCFGVIAVGLSMVVMAWSGDSGVRPSASNGRATETEPGAGADVESAIAAPGRDAEPTSGGLAAYEPLRRALDPSAVHEFQPVSDHGRDHPLGSLPQPLRDEVAAAIGDILWHCEQEAIPFPRGAPRISFANARALLQAWENHAQRVQEADDLYYDEITRVAEPLYDAGDVVVPGEGFTVQDDDDALLWLKRQGEYREGDHVCRFIDHRGVVFVHVRGGADESLDMARDYRRSFTAANADVYRRLRGFLSFPDKAAD